MAEAAELMKMTAKDLLENKVIDRMFPEPKEGLENNLDASRRIKESLIRSTFQTDGRGDFSFIRK